MSSIAMLDKSRQQRIFDTSDFINGNHNTEIMNQHPVVRQSDFLVKHGSNLPYFAVHGCGDSFKAKSDSP